MGALSQKIPIFLVEPCREMGIVWLKAPIFGALGNGSFLTPKPSFPHFGDFDPCGGGGRFRTFQKPFRDPFGDLQKPPTVLKHYGAQFRSVFY